MRARPYFHGSKYFLLLCQCLDLYQFAPEWFSSIFFFKSKNIVTAIGHWDWDEYETHADLQRADPISYLRIGFLIADLKIQLLCVIYYKRSGTAANHHLKLVMKVFKLYKSSTKLC